VNKTTARRPRLLTAMASLLLAVGVLSTIQYGGTTAASASSSLTARPAARVLPAQAPISEICTDQGAQSLCANRDLGGENPDTHIIAWSAGDPNNDFAFTYLSAMCGNGRVNWQTGCPFSSSGDLNYRYSGDMIAAIFNLTTGLCIADSGTTSGLTVLGTCPNPEGAGGSNGTIFVLSDVTNPVVPPPTTYVVNRFWSNNTYPGGGSGTEPRWLCVIAKAQGIIENSDTAGDPTNRCRWNEIH
jgi:hypothetical protein